MILEGSLNMFRLVQKIKQKEQIDVGLKTCLKLIDEKTKEQAPKESSNTVVVITWESGMVNVYRKDSPELLEALIH